MFHISGVSQFLPQQRVRHFLSSKIWNDTLHRHHPGSQGRSGDYHQLRVRASSFLKKVNFRLILFIILIQLCTLYPINWQIYHGKFLTVTICQLLRPGTKWPGPSIRKWSGVCLTGGQGYMTHMTYDTSISRLWQQDTPALSDCRIVDIRRASSENT